MQTPTIFELNRRYNSKAKHMSVAELKYAISDITETMEIMKDKGMDDPYVQKLYAEFDAYTVEYQRRH